MTFTILISDDEFSRVRRSWRKLLTKLRQATYATTEQSMLTRAWHIKFQTVKPFKRCTVCRKVQPTRRDGSIRTHPYKVGSTYRPECLGAERRGRWPKGAPPERAKRKPRRK